MTRAATIAKAAVAALAVFLGSSPPLLVAQKARIEDNSFLLEEAYNQESGIVQHISNLLVAGPRHRDFGYSFTQEWPLGGQRHQLSYTLPFIFLDSGGQGLAAVALNYRYQLLGQGRVFVAPRLSILLPTGSVAAGVSARSTGVQIALPVSVRVTTLLAAHANAGFTVIPSVRDTNGAGHSLTVFTFGASVIAPVTAPFQFMLEFLAIDAASVDPAGAVTRATDVIANPGFRCAIDVGGVQIVPGFSVPMHLRDASKPHNLFFYLSFEHAFKRVHP